MFCVVQWNYPHINPSRAARRNPVCGNPSTQGCEWRAVAARDLTAEVFSIRQEHKWFSSISLSSSDSPSEYTNIMLYTVHCLKSAYVAQHDRISLSREQYTCFVSEISGIRILAWGTVIVTGVSRDISQSLYANGGIVLTLDQDRFLQCDLQFNIHYPSLITQSYII